MESKKAVEIFKGLTLQVPTLVQVPTLAPSEIVLSVRHHIHKITISLVIIPAVSRLPRFFLLSAFCFLHPNLPRIVPRLALDFVLVSPASV